MTSDTVKFGAFAFGLRTLELHKHGVRIKLQEQPSRVLAALVANPGEIVSRERLQQELWPGASFGEFEAGLNTALSKLRAVLGDSAANPIFIERVPRQGYRFVAPLRSDPVPVSAPLDEKDAPVAPAGPLRPGSRLVYLVLALLGGAAVAGLLAWNRANPAMSSGAPIRFTIHLPPGQQLAVGRMPGRAVGISRDGNTIGYLASTGDTTQVYVRKFSEAEFRIAPGTQGATDFVLSGDGQEVLYLANGAWWKVGLSNASPVARAVIQPSQKVGAGAIWGEGEAIYAPVTQDPSRDAPASVDTSVYRIAPGKDVRQITVKTRGELRSYFPQQVLPGGTHLLVSGNSGPTDRSVAIVSLTDNKLTPIVDSAMGGYVLASGHLVYFWRDTLLAAPFDSRTAKALGPGVPVVNQVAVNQWLGSQSAISSNGTLVYIPKPSTNRALVWTDRSGKETAFEVPPGPYVFLSLSPSGTRFVVYRDDGDQSGIWMYDQNAGGKWKRLVAGTWPNTSAAWSPDEKSLVFTAALQGEAFENLYLMRLDPPGGPERIAPSAHGQFAQGWSASSGLIYTESDKPDTRIDLHRILWNHGVPHSEPLVTTPAHDAHGSVSPDGRWVAYSSATDHRPDVYTRAIGAGPAGVGTKVTPNGGFCPLWSPAGDEIFYRRQNAMWSVRVKEGKPAGNAVRLFETTASCTVWNREFGVSADGLRFLGTKPVPDPDDRRQIRVVLNWTTELEQIVPSRR